MFKKVITSSIIALIWLAGFLGNVQNQEWGNSIVVINSTFAAWEGWSQDPCVWENPPASCQSLGQNKDKWLDTTQTMLQNLVNGLNIFLDILTIIVSPAIILASWLMSPDWTSGDLFGIRSIIHDLWVTISNITYFIYAILLIFIALATIFNSEHYGYKQLLPRLAVGILLVPLTWWFVSFIISLSTVITASVINIPAEALSKFTDGKTTTAWATSWWKDPSIPTFLEFKNNKLYANWSAFALWEDWGSTCNEWKSNCISPQKFIKSSGWMYSWLMVYSYWVFRFQDIKKINTKKDVILSVGQIINQWIVWIIMFIIYWLLVLALIFALLMRAIKLWFYTIFSPLFTLKYVIGDGFSKVDKDGTFNVTEFIALAFTPAIVWLALSFGLMIVSVLHNPATPNAQKCTATECTLTMFGNPENKITSKIESGDGGEKSKTITSVIAGGVTYQFEWSVVSNINDSGVWQVKSVLDMSWWIIGTIILDIIALVFIWVAFMAAAGLSKATAKAVEPFKQMGEKIGSLWAKLPQYAPIPGLGLSVKGMERAAGDVSHLIEKAANDKYEHSAVGKMLHADLNIPETEISKMRKAIKEWHGDAKNIMHQWMKEYGSRQNWWDSHLPETIYDELKWKSQEDKNKYYRDMGIDGDKLTEFMNKNTSGITTDSQKKELWGLMQNAWWSGSGQNWWKAWAWSKTITGETDWVKPIKINIDNNGIATKIEWPDLANEDKLTARLITALKWSSIDEKSLKEKLDSLKVNESEKISKAVIAWIKPEASNSH